MSSSLQRASVLVTSQPHSPDTPSASSHVPRAPASPPSHQPYAGPDYHHYRQHSQSQHVGVSDTPLPLRMSNPIKRKPVSSSSSPLVAAPPSSSSLPPSTNNTAPSQVSNTWDSPAPLQPPAVPPKHDSLTNPQTPVPSYQSPAPNTAAIVEPATASQQNQSDLSAQGEESDILSAYDDSASDTGSISVYDRTPATILDDRSDDARSTNSYHHDNPRPPMLAPKPTPLHLNLQRVDSTKRVVSPSSTPIQTSLSPQDQRKASPKATAPASPFAAFFGWGNQSPAATEFSSIPSPSSLARKGTLNESSRPSTSRANASTENALGYCESYLSTPPPSNSIPAEQIDEMEEELKAISSELAASIRREMDLEDLVERLQEQANSSQTPGRRTSDYFSDSGYSSAKVSEYDQNREEVERIQRRSEQEKASIRLELTTKLQEERQRRHALDDQIRALSERSSQIDLAQMQSSDASDRIKSLEATCDDLRRRLNDERDSKSNFADLLSGLKSELKDACNERDNLRDEIVPQLRSRIEGLETEAAEYANLTYESTKLQQELQQLKEENITLRNSNVSDETPVQSAVQSARSSRAMSGGLFRSNSVATLSGRSQKPQPPPLPLSRSKSVKNTQLESREALAERLKDVEAQRDALHIALKNLLERQEIHNRDNEKRIRALEQERQRLILGSPRKGGFSRDIANLRTEVNVLRRRAEDALEQKWQVEKGLSGLKMDLDRAEEEIALLRNLLKEKDILIPPSIARSSNSSNLSDSPVTSESLRMAYKNLQLSYTDSLERIRKLEIDSSVDASDEQTQQALRRLERSLALAISEHDEAATEADRTDTSLGNAPLEDSRSMMAEQVFANELADSARLVEHLAAQVRRQLSMNAELRQRLAGAVSRGEADRKANSERIADLQERLRVLEEELVTAQAASEDKVAFREEEVLNLKEANNSRLHRKTRSFGQKSPGLKSPRKSPLLTPMGSPMFPRSPRLTPAKSFEEQAEINVLRAKIASLEKALSETETEMQDVVARMSTAQIEVLNLQEEREAAVRETRRLQRILEEEQVKAFEDRFRTLATTA